MQLTLHSLHIKLKFFFFKLQKASKFKILNMTLALTKTIKITLFKLELNKYSYELIKIDLSVGIS
jgi:hypothetical protein